MDYDELMTTTTPDPLMAETTTELAQRTARVLGLYDIFIPLLGAFIIVFNLAVVVSSGLILKKGQQPRSTYLFLGNVGLTDLLTGFAVLFGQFYPSQYRDEVSCAIQIGMIVSATVTSVYSVGLIAIDRFLYILYGLQYQRWVYPNRARLLILITWIIGIVIGFLPAFGWRGDTDNGRRCWFILIAPPELVLLTSVLGLVPLLVVVVLYSIILHHALRKVIQLKRAARNHSGVGAVSGNLRMHVGMGSPSMSSTGGGGGAGTAAAVEMSHNTRSDNNTEGGRGAALSDTEEPLQPKKRSGIFKFLSRQKTEATPSTTTTSVVLSSATNNGSRTTTTTPARTNKSLSKWKAIKVVLFTTGSFVITWVPYFIACVMYVNCDWTETPDRCRSIQVAIASPLAILGFANSLTNPIIYAWWHNGFRQSAKAIFCGAACRKKRRSESDGPSMSTGTKSGSSAGPTAARGRRTRTSEVEESSEVNYIRQGAAGGGGEGENAIAKSTKNGHNGNSFALSTTTLDVSATDLDLSDMDGSSDVESALRRRVDVGGIDDGGEGQKQQQQHQQRATVNGGTSAVNVCYQNDASGH